METVWNQKHDNRLRTLFLVCRLLAIKTNLKQYKIKRGKIHKTKIYNIDYYQMELHFRLTAAITLK